MTPRLQDHVILEHHLVVQIMPRVLESKNISRGVETLKSRDRCQCALDVECGGCI